MNATPIDEWIESNQPANDMLWKDSFTRQVEFMRNKIPSILGDATMVPMVISTHVSKSITLPVIKVTIGQLTVIARDNFYNWAFSIISELAVRNLREFTEENKKAPGYPCEGFPKKYLFGPKAENNHCFTCHVWTHPEKFLDSLKPVTSPTLQTKNKSGTN